MREAAGHEDSYSEFALFRAGFRSGLRAWSCSNVVCGAARRNEIGRVDGNAGDAFGHRRGRTLDSGAPCGVLVNPCTIGHGLHRTALMLAAEFGLVLRIRGISVRQYLATRDRVSGAAYYVMLIVFAVMPLLMAKL